MSSTFSKFFAVFVKYWVLHGYTSYFLQVFYLQFAPKDRILESYTTDLGVTLYDENLPHAGQAADPRGRYKRGGLDLPDRPHRKRGAAGGNHPGH